MTGAGWRRRLWTAVAVTWMLILVFTVGVLSIRAVGEAARFGRVVEESLREDCQFFGGLAGAPVPPSTTGIGRRLVLDAKRSYDARSCDRLFGAVAVDPEVYRPALPPETVAPTPSPTR